MKVSHIQRNHHGRSGKEQGECTHQKEIGHIKDFPDFLKGQQKHYILTNVSSEKEKINLLMTYHGGRQNYDLPSRLEVVGLDLPRGISTCLR